MTFKFKLARRIATARARVLLPVLLLIPSACGDPVVSEGFGPPDPTDAVAIAVAPKLDTIRTDDSVKLHAKAQTVAGDTVAADSDVDWFASGGTITPDGTFRSTTTGQFTLLARHKRHQKLIDTATVVVLPSLATVSAVVVSPASLTLPIGGSANLSASARMSDGATAPVSVTWSATGGTISTSGSYTAGGTPGAFRIIAVQAGGTLADTAPVTISAPTLAAIFISPGTASLASGASQQFSAAGQLSDGSSTNVAVTWSATGGTVTSSGLYTAGTTAGTFRVIARQSSGTLADTAVVGIAVPAPTLQQIVLTPATTSLQTGATQQFASSGLMSDGSSMSVAVSYSATGGSITAGGLYTAGTAAGTYRVIATQSGGTLADTSSVTVTAPTLQQVVLTPAAISMLAGTIQQFSASGRLSDGSVTSVAVNYAATGGSITSGGLYTAGSTAGTFRVIATQSGGSLADTSTVTITAATLTQVILLPATASVAVGATQQFTVSGILNNGATTTPAVTYSGTGGTITAGGLYTAGATAGTFRVIATQQGGTLADTSTVTVTTAPPVLQAVILTPATASVATAATQQFTVSGQWSNGATTAPAVTYSATGGTITTGGLYTAGSSAGSFRVIATQQGGTLADTSAVTVTAAPPPTLTGVILSPATVSIATGGVQQFSVSGQWSNGATTAPAVTYAATGGTITTGGLYTAGSTAGTFRVIATQQGGTLADTSAVTIGSSSEPVFNAATNTIVYQDAFDSYSGTPGGSWLKTPTGVTIVSPGVGGAGKAARVTYTPSDFYGAIDLYFNATPHIFVSYYFRTSPGFDPAANDNTGSGMKWFTLWRSGGAERQTWGANQLGGVAHTTFGVHDNSSTSGNVMPNPVNGASGLFLTVNDGNWHRYTIEAYTGTGTDGYERCWLDGVKIFDTSGRGYSRSTVGFNELKFPSDMVRPPAGTATVDIDTFVSWTP